MNLETLTLYSSDEEEHQMIMGELKKHDTKIKKNKQYRSILKVKINPNKERELNALLEQQQQRELNKDLDDDKALEMEIKRIQKKKRINRRWIRLEQLRHKSKNLPQS